MQQQADEVVLVKPNYLKQVDWMKSPGKLLKKKKNSKKQEGKQEGRDREGERGRKEQKKIAQESDCKTSSQLF